ncbi:hypothetical protein [[Mycobacterium] nativiensis]|uniref:Uncharacterized protein n=1 Tax=[Mycobacterium] nativiensis TaxID=2855503 RepID=A0ABU5XWZ0_9MYCO|nr:hypothetical protein [Mycolicibacter sp. MYC340]MEB3032292.1 hypothetical protein [Mycolicibacter sp. MYC340]
MTNETLHDGDFDLRPEDAPHEWVAFKREARFQTRVREGHSASIELFPCDALSCEMGGDEDDCSDRVVAVVSDDHEIGTRRALCEAHLVMYLADVIPTVHNLEHLYRNHVRPN